MLHISINFTFWGKSNSGSKAKKIFCSVHSPSKNLMMLQKLKINFSRCSLQPWDSQWYLFDEGLHDNFPCCSAASMICSSHLSHSMEILLKQLIIGGSLNRNNDISC
ncbi:uncharacterized protein LOC122537129 [Frieseomelitta varia]|uniref:uncharacterized protein LOC122537129 n=1 Tax=Frieseomelitta varia TaxID=561572 RepID=UPI001CB6B60B|nr:uncharacterized protein LOC122537129 [Frieseomelitta varia]